MNNHAQKSLSPLVLLCATYTLSLDYLAVSTYGRKTQLFAYNRFSSLATLFALIIVVFCIQQLTLGLKSHLFDKELTPIVVLTLLAWLSVAFSNIQSGTPVSRQAFLFPLVFFTALYSRDLRIWGSMTLCLISILIMSLLMIVLQPRIAFFNPFGFIVDKGIFLSSVLAGPFSHPNALGSIILLLTPLVVYYVKKLRSVLLIASATLLTLTQSRTNIILFLIWIFIVTVSKNSTVKKGIFFAATVGSFILMVVLPFTIRDQSFLTGRGDIWIQTRKIFLEKPFFGHGDNFFLNSGLNNVSFAREVLTSHNLLLDLLVRFGIIGALLFFIPLFLSFRRIYKKPVFSDLRASLLFLFIANGITENNISFFTVGDISGFLWFVLILIHTDAPRSKTDTKPSSSLASIVVR